MRYRSTATVNVTYEAAGVAYNTAAIYVVGSFDEKLFTEIEDKCRAQVFAALSWLPDPRLILLSGPNGKQAIRFADLDASGRFLRFFTKPRQTVYSSLPLLKATAHDPLIFLREHLSSPVIHATKLSKSGLKGTGIVIGNSESDFSALLILEQDRLRILDVQPKERGSKHEYTLVKPVDDAAAAGTRSDYGRILSSSRIVAGHVFNNNTQLMLEPAEPVSPAPPRP